VARITGLSVHRVMAVCDRLLRPAINETDRPELFW